jgi:hypothetical protein
MKNETASTAKARQRRTCCIGAIFIAALFIAAFLSLSLRRPASPVAAVRDCDPAKSGNSSLGGRSRLRRTGRVGASS